MVAGIGPEHLSQVATSEAHDVTPQIRDIPVYRFPVPHSPAPHPSRKQCNPYCVLEQTGFKHAAPLAFWGPVRMARGSRWMDIGARSDGQVDGDRNKNIDWPVHAGRESQGMLARQMVISLGVPPNIGLRWKFLLGL